MSSSITVTEPSQSYCVCIRDCNSLKIYRIIQNNMNELQARVLQHKVEITSLDWNHGIIMSISQTEKRRNHDLLDDIKREMVSLIKNDTEGKTIIDPLSISLIDFPDDKILYSSGDESDQETQEKEDQTFKKKIREYFF